MFARRFGSRCLQAGLSSKSYLNHSSSSVVRLARFSSSRRLFERKTVLNTGILFVPEQQAYVVERFGKYQRLLDPGLQICIPIIDRIAYVHSLKVETIEIRNQSAVISRDNSSLHMDGVLYYQIHDPVKASYNVEDPEFAIKQLAMSTMRSEIGQLTLDECFRERTALNHRIVEAINDAVKDFGIRCHRYEVREIAPTDTVISAMELEVVAERKRRQAVIESEGEKRAAINVAEGEKASQVLASEAAAAEILNMRRAEADGIRLVAEAQASATSAVAKVLNHDPSANDAASLGVAQQYIQAFGKLAGKSNTMILPASANDPASMVAQAMAVYKTVNESNPANESSTNSSNISNVIGIKPGSASSSS